MTDTKSLAERQPKPVWGWVKRILAILGIVILSVLAVILLVGLLPVSTEGLAPQPEPAGSYEEAVARFEEAQQAEQGIVNEASGS